MREIGRVIGQRPGWRPLHEGTTVHLDGVDWQAGLEVLAVQRPSLAAWAEAAVGSTAAELAATGADELPLTVVHGDFAPWNVHYAGPALAGVVDFGLVHVDSRPYELAMARSYRAPVMLEGYREELERQGWPLSELEEAAIEPVYRAFRMLAVSWELQRGLRAGNFDNEQVAHVERQLAATGAPRPG